MKLIPKFLLGGFSQYYVDYQIAPSYTSIFSLVEGNSSKKSSESSEKGKLTEKDLFDKFANFDGLPSDMNYIIGLTKQMYAQAEHFGDSSSLVSISALRDLALNTARFNKLMYDEAFNALKKNGGLNEIAMTDGEVVVYNSDGEIDTVSPSEYLKNKDLYKPITNSNLLWMRAYKKEYANDSSIINIANNGIGMDDIVKLIQERIGDLGSNKTTRDGYIAKQGNLITKGLELLTNADLVINERGMTLDGVYKAKSVTQDLKKQIQAALNYVYSSLSPEAQSLLLIKGNDSKNPVNGALNLIFLKLTAQSSESFESTIDYQKDMNLDGSSKSSSKGRGEDYPKENAALALMLGRGLTENVLLVPGTNVGYRVSGNTIPIIGTDNKPDSSIKYLDELRGSGLSPILDFSNATMGGNKIDPMAFNQVALTEGNVHAIYFPTIDGITPDLREPTLEAKQKADEILKDKGIDVNKEEDYKAHYNEIVAEYNKVGIPSNNLKRFVVVGAITNNKALGVEIFDDTPFLQSVDDTSEKNYISLWQQDHSKGGVRQKLDFDNYQWYNPADWFGNYDDVYKGLVWIPMLENYYNALLGTGEKIDTSIAQEYDKLQAKRDMEKELINSYIDPSQYE